MTRRVLLRCFLVSLVASVAVLPATFVALAPDTDQQVPDPRALETDKINSSSTPEQVAEYVKTIPMHKVQGIERITYWFSHPHWYIGLWRGVITWFLFFFASTVFVSFLNARDKK
jgi:hypothetical protein